ncbi:hypothetical protein BGZ65_005553 [Modicella reniformis]|uniref:Uncharacterized protein n=1 Tax=Modicella reniformis TaxID=1440133 RepID=A0A9P6IM12_9FUNG|nr:hypothetical protein BGZ65_005553 [Modicella reniformis]
MSYSEESGINVYRDQMEDFAGIILETVQAKEDQVGAGEKEQVQVEVDDKTDKVEAHKTSKKYPYLICDIETDYSTRLLFNLQDFITIANRSQVGDLYRSGLGTAAHSPKTFKIMKALHPGFKPRATVKLTVITTSDPRQITNSLDNKSQKKDDLVTLCRKDNCSTSTLIFFGTKQDRDNKNRYSLLGLMDRVIRNNSDAKSITQSPYRLTMSVNTLSA